MSGTQSKTQLKRNIFPYQNSKWAKSEGNDLANLYIYTIETAFPSVNLNFLSKFPIIRKQLQQVMRGPTIINVSWILFHLDHISRWTNYYHAHVLRISHLPRLLYKHRRIEITGAAPLEQLAFPPLKFISPETIDLFVSRCDRDTRICLIIIDFLIS